jgi:MFS family permease
LHSVPPFAAAFGLCIVVAYFSDRAGIRFPFILFGQALLIAGLAILLSIAGKNHFPAEYAGICLVAMGAFTAGAGIVCWYLMNLHGHANRSIGSAWMISFGNTGGIVATFSFLKQDAPYYRTGYWILMSVAIVGTVATILYAALVQKERREASRVDNEKANTLSL